MEAFVIRYIVIFLIFWLGLTLLKCLPTFREHYRHNPEITWLKLETKRLELMEAELQVNLLGTRLDHHSLRPPGQRRPGTGYNRGKGQETREPAPAPGGQPVGQG